MSKCGKPAFLSSESVRLIHIHGVIDSSKKLRFIYIFKLYKRIKYLQI